MFFNIFEIIFIAYLVLFCSLVVAIIIFVSCSIIERIVFCQEFYYVILRIIGLLGGIFLGTDLDSVFAVRDELAAIREAQYVRRIVAELAEEQERTRRYNPYTLYFAATFESLPSFIDDDSGMYALCRIMSRFSTIRIVTRGVVPAFNNMVECDEYVCLDRRIIVALRDRFLVPRDALLLDVYYATLTRFDNMTLNSFINLVYDAGIRLTLEAQAAEQLQLQRICYVFIRQIVLVLFSYFSIVVFLCTGIIILCFIIFIILRTRQILATSTQMRIAEICIIYIICICICVIVCVLIVCTVCCYLDFIVPLICSYREIIN